jgi:hypothetical protein
MCTWLKQNAADVIGSLLTLIGIVVATITVVWQLGRQHRSVLQLQRDNAREDLKLRLHELLVAKVRKLNRANTQAAMYAFMIPFNIENYNYQLALGAKPAPMEQRVTEFSRLHSGAIDALVELIEEFEAWSVAFPGLEVFQIALNSANHNTSEAFMPLFSALVTALPFDPPEDAHPSIPRPVVPKTLSIEKLSELKMMVDQYKKGRDEIGSYIHDLMIESQNNLLSGLFERRVSARRPIDPKLKVISTEPEAAKNLGVKPLSEYHEEITYIFL